MDPKPAIDEILISLLETNGVTRARAQQLIAEDPGTISELISAQVSGAETQLMQASLVLGP